MEGEHALAALIRAEHLRWADPMVDRATFGDPDPAAIAAKVCAYAEATLGAAVTGARFYRVSVGCVAGVNLADGRSAAIKVRRDARSAAFFQACHRVLEHLRAGGFPCPEPLAEPLHSNGVWWTTERLLERGERRSAHEPEVRRAVARSLAEVVRLAAPLGALPGLSGAWFSSLPDERVFPKPHSPYFDFEATRAGAEWIEALAKGAREQRHEAEGRFVIGHFDWRVEHLRFSGAEVVASYDWDSLHWERETVMVGAAAHAFTADWSRDDWVRVPSPGAMWAFVDDYETARGSAFSAEERRTIAASLVYSLAYTARCNHADPERAGQEGWNGDFRGVLSRCAP